jgi:hypothetical protein
MPDFTEHARKQIQHWHQVQKESSLSSMSADGKVIVQERRANFIKRDEVFEAEYAAILDYCWRIRPRWQIEQHISRSCSRGEAGKALGQLQDAGFIFGEEELYLSLPLRQPGFTRAVQRDQIRTARGRAYLDLGMYSNP